MSGGGHIIIRDAKKQALSNPLVHGALPAAMQTAIAPALAKDTVDWTADDDHETGRAFAWAEKNC